MTAPGLTDWPQQAGILCNDPQFQRFVVTRVDPDLSHHFYCASFAAEYLRRFCNIQSRRDLAHNIDARARFRILRTEFDAWSGRIAPPR